MYNLLLNLRFDILTGSIGIASTIWMMAIFLITHSLYYRIHSGNLSNIYIYALLIFKRFQIIDFLNENLWILFQIALF